MFLKDTSLFHAVFSYSEQIYGDNFILLLQMI